MKPTDEQRIVCTSTAHVMKIKAGAGTGKTTTLRGLAARNPRSRMLYLAFNKAIKDEARDKFGPHVRAMTAHGMAFAAIGRDYANEPGKLSHGGLKPYHVLPQIEASTRKLPPALHNLYGARVIEAIGAFLISDDEVLGRHHIPVSVAPAEKKHFDPARMNEDANVVLGLMADIKGKVPMTHDGYLKLFALENPKLPCDFLLLDEAQDTNPVLQGMVGRQACRRAYVGDEHQAIYSFRGARNAMAGLEADAEYALTGSFRFGPEIASVANMLLQAKGENSLRLQGLGRAGELRIVTGSQPHAFISRSNSGLFGRAVEAMERRQPFAFVGPLQGYRLDLIEQTYNLSSGNQVSDPFLRAFDSFEQLQEYAEVLNDREILARCSLVQRYGRKLPSLLDGITRTARTFPGDGNMVVLTTAHRAKGLEFETVKLADDFTDFSGRESDWIDLSRATPEETEEVNLLYVAVTRAKGILEVNPGLKSYLRDGLPLQREIWNKRWAEEMARGLPQAQAPDRTRARL